MKAILTTCLSGLLAGCVLGSETVQLVSSPILEQNASYTLVDEQVKWDTMAMEFVVNNHNRLRYRKFAIGESDDWVEDPVYIYGGKTPFALSMCVELKGGKAISLDIGSVTLNHDASAALSPKTVSVEGTDGHSVCHSMTAWADAYSPPVGLDTISLAVLPQRRGDQGCIRFIFDVPVEIMNPANKFSLSAIFIIDGKESAETIYFGPRVSSWIAR
ncbi:MAG: hypothetical protein KDI33_14435 [Halioglobus sp.]|nr:hypothetical protein [Halioglobus sp.]